MKPGYQIRHEKRIQLALDLMLEMSDKLHQMQESMSQQKANEDLNAVHYFTASLVEQAHFIGIKNAVERLEKIESIKG